MSLDNGALDERILILAPHGRDAEVIHQVLARNGFGGGAVANFDAMVAELQTGAGACVIAEEALQDSSVNQLLAWLRTQEPWSDFPFVILISKRNGLTPQAARSTFDQLGNIILLERPLNAETLRSAAASASTRRARSWPSACAWRKACATAGPSCCN